MAADWDWAQTVNPETRRLCTPRSSAPSGSPSPLTGSGPVTNCPPSGSSPSRFASTPTPSPRSTPTSSEAGRSKPGAAWAHSSSTTRNRLGTTRRAMPSCVPSRCEPSQRPLHGGSPGGFRRELQNLKGARVITQQSMSRTGSRPSSIQKKTKGKNQDVTLQRTLNRFNWRFVFTVLIFCKCRCQ